MDIILIIPISVTVAGGFLLLKLKGFFLFHPVKTAKKFMNAISRKGAFGNLTLALAGTLGVGNIFGVAAGISVGGVGSIFWLLVASIFSTVIKYAETVTSVDHSVTDGNVRLGGIMYTLKDCFKTYGGKVSVVYAVLCIALGLFMGCAFQSYALVSAADGVIACNKFILASATVVVVLFLIAVGKSRIERITTILIPVATLLYTAVALTVISANADKLPLAVSEILRDAFRPRAVGGGFLAHIFNSAMHEGFCTGILSNEAGVGTSAMANTRNRNTTPCESGLFGACEVFFDSVLLCTLTGLAITVSVPDPTRYTGSELINLTFSSVLGDGVSSAVIFLCVVCFALSTVVCWYYYIGTCRRFLFGERAEIIFLAMLTGAVFIGPFAPELMILRSTDILLALMSLPTLLCIIKNSDRVVALSENEGLI